LYSRKKTLFAYSEQQLNARAGKPLLRSAIRSIVLA
jgi:hypothetical protein